MLGMIPSVHYNTTTGVRRNLHRFRPNKTYYTHSMVHNELSHLSGTHPEQLSSRYAMRDVFRAAKKDPEQFWQHNLAAAQKGFARAAFVGHSENADICVVIPAHNETVGLKDGNLQANLFALSQQDLPEGVRIKVKIVAHNCSAEDVTQQLASALSLKIDVLSYTTPLRGYSYPLQLAGALLEENEAKYVGIVDADTVLDQSWITHMYAAITQDKRIGAVASPREYLERSGGEVPYGRIKTTAERMLHALPKVHPKMERLVKLVYGSSFYTAEVFHAMGMNHMGEIMPEGVVEQDILTAGKKIVFEPRARSVSDGEKFAHKAPFELIKTIIEKTRVAFLRSHTTDDHLAFIMVELARYFPEFGKRVAVYMPQYEAVKKGTLTPEQEAELLTQLMKELSQFNSEGRAQMQHDVQSFVVSRH